MLSIVNCSPGPASNLNVSVAASVTDAINEIDSLYVKTNPDIAITPNFSSSGTLEKQIENGAPADIFLSASKKQMDLLDEKQLLLDGTRKNLLMNKVVLIVPEGSTLGLTSFKDLTSDKVKQIAIGDPEFVPAGTYAQKVFDLLGITEEVKPKYVIGSDVRQVLAYVESGNVDAGVVYMTDTVISDSVKIVAEGPEEVNSTIVYPVAVIKDSKNIEAAKKYENYLFSAEAKAVFEKFGFTVISE